MNITFCAIVAGYFSNEEATASTLDSEGWLRTGDLCYIDEDGFIFVVDRLKELIKYKGYQVNRTLIILLHFFHYHFSGYWLWNLNVAGSSCRIRSLVTYSSRDLWCCSYTVRFLHYKSSFVIELHSYETVCVYSEWNWRVWLLYVEFQISWQGGWAISHGIHCKKSWKRFIRGCSHGFCC